MRQFTRIWLPIAGAVAAITTALLVGASAANAGENWDTSVCKDVCPTISVSPFPS